MERESLGWAGACGFCPAGGGGLLPVTMAVYLEVCKG